MAGQETQPRRWSGSTDRGNRLKDERVVKFSTPFVNFNIEISDYEHIEKRIKAVDIAKEEAIEYVNGKFKSQGTQVGVFDTPDHPP
jgi:uncharacterized Fe-S cluster-containing protein